MTPKELKKELTARGLLVYRTLADGVALAEYERENLLVDAGIRVLAVPDLGLEIRFRVEQHAFPGEPDPKLYERARKLAQQARLFGLLECHVERTPQPSASDPERVMDTFFDVVYRSVASDLDQLVAHAKQALASPRSLGG